MERCAGERRCQRVIVRVVEVSTRRIVVQIIAQGRDREKVRVNLGRVAVVGMNVLERSQAECG